MELTVTEMRDKISLCVIDRDMVAMAKLRDSMKKDSKVMDKWFDKYLEMMERKMKPETPNTPEWKLYHKKSDEYSELTTLIKTADNYVRQLQTV